MYMHIYIQSRLSDDHVLYLKYWFKKIILFQRTAKRNIKVSIKVYILTKEL